MNEQQPTYGVVKFVIGTRRLHKDPGALDAGNPVSTRRRHPRISAKRDVADVRQCCRASSRRTRARRTTSSSTLSPIACRRHRVAALPTCGSAESLINRQPRPRRPRQGAVMAPSAVPKYPVKTGFPAPPRPPLHRARVGSASGARAARAAKRIGRLQQPDAARCAAQRSSATPDYWAEGRS